MEVFDLLIYEGFNMHDVIELLKSLGGVHDATMLNLFWRADDRILEVEIDDVYSNFNGLPEYQGPEKAMFVFEQVLNLDVGVDFGVGGLLVYNFEIFKTDNGSYSSKIEFSPAGVIRIECANVRCVKATAQA